MAYCTVQDMQTRFGDYELIQLTNPGGTDIDTLPLDQAISDAAAEIEIYLGGRYSLPLDPVPTGLNRIACNMARYYLHDLDKPEPIETAYKNAIDFLKRVAKGEISLGIATDGSQAQQTESTAEIQSGGSVWSRNNSGGFI